MDKGHANRLSEQQKKGGGPASIFGSIAKTHEKAVANASAAVYEALTAAYPELRLRRRNAISKREINAKLHSLDERLGKELFVKEASIMPDGAIIEVQDRSEDWRIVLVSEAKYQGMDAQNIAAGNQVGKNKNQDLMVAGNAIERVHKNINEIRNAMLGELHFPYVVFLQGSNFATETFEVTRPDGRIVRICHDKGGMGRIDRVTAANYSMAINSNHCKNLIVKIEGNEVILQAASIYARSDAWTSQEMAAIMADIAETSLAVLSPQVGLV